MLIHHFLEFFDEKGGVDVLRTYSYSVHKHKHKQRVMCWKKGSAPLILTIDIITISLLIFFWKQHHKNFTHHSYLS